VRLHKSARDVPLNGEYGSYLIIIHDNPMSSSLPQAPHAYAFSPEVAPAPKQLGYPYIKASVKTGTNTEEAKLMLIGD
jgi:hypothetical protein